VYTLIAGDINRVGVDCLLERLEGHVVMVSSKEDGERGYPVHRITLGATIRNTEAHGLACRLGFLAHVE
jgi:hypothetical protein